MAQFTISRRLRRKLGSFFLYAVLAVALTAVGLTLRTAHCLRQAEETTTELRRLGAGVRETLQTDGRWLRFARTLGISPGIGLFDWTTYGVNIDDVRDTGDALRVAARLPELVALDIRNAPNFD